MVGSYDFYESDVRRIVLVHGIACEAYAVYAILNACLWFI
jgi:hypothetical protein